VEWDKIMTKPHLGLSLMVEPEFLRATYPLFDNSEVDVIEWSFDTVLDPSAQADWMDSLLNEYGKSNRLVAHGVYFSTLNARWSSRQESWLRQMKEEFQRHNYSHLTEHFGFMSGLNAHNGCPLPTPFDGRSLAIGIDRLKRLQAAAEVPVGIENLALSFSLEDVKIQGEFLSNMVAPINGFLILDLHNLYCQAHNFDIPLIDLVQQYPLHLVKEIHISGGSWQDSIYGDAKIRRDTHDEAVPEILFDILPSVLSICPHLEIIILERLGHSFHTEQDILQHQKDFRRLRAIIDVNEAAFSLKNWGNKAGIDKALFSNDSLYEEQRYLHKTLLGAKTLMEIKEKLHNQLEIENWDDEMLNTAAILVKKWE
jgi:uncharacterized protein